MFALICFIIERITGEPCFTAKAVNLNADNDVFHYYHDCDDFNDFGRAISEDELNAQIHEWFIADFIDRMWNKYHIIVTREEVEEALSQMEESKPCNDEQSSPIFIDRSRNNHVVIGHQMRPQTASLAAERVRRQKIC